MYFPYLRGKQFELEALLEVNPQVYQNTIPIVEPVTDARPVRYTRISNLNIPFIFVTNPFYPVNDRLTPATIQNLIDNELAGNAALRLGFLLDARYNIAALNQFLANNAGKAKSLIFRFNPLPADLVAILAAINATPVEFLIFDDRRTNANTRNAFNAHGGRILLTDGFQAQDANANYPAMSAFDSNFNTWNANGWTGIGDYATVGDNFRDGGGPAYVISLHVTVQDGGGLVVHHFSSTVNANIMGRAPQKFAQANSFLVASPVTIPLNSTGLTLFRNWHATHHNPQLGAAKKASIIHHIELMSSIV